MSLWDIGEFFGGFHPIEWAVESWEEACEEEERKKRKEAEQESRKIQAEAKDKQKFAESELEEKNAKTFSRNKIKGLANKYKLSLNTDGRSINALIKNIMTDGNMETEKKLAALYLKSPLMTGLEQKIDKEKLKLEQQEKAFDFLNNLEGKY